MSAYQPSKVYREQLSSLYHGLALWNPRPVDSEGLYGHVSIGDVGYLLENGAFMRLFNVTLPWDDPSNRLLEVAEEYKPLELGHFINIHSSEMHQREHCSHVSKVDNIHARTYDEDRGQMYECQAQSHGALLSLPHGGRSKDVIRTKVFKDYIKNNVGSWFHWSEENGFPVEHMEDLILVTGCTLATSWAAAVFNNSQMANSNAPTISLEIEKFDRGGARFFWRNDRGNVDYDNSHFDPTVEGPLHLDQCVFIRGFRARRIFFWIKPMRAAAESLPDDPDNRRDEIQVTRIPDGSKYRDPLFAILDYIEEKCHEHSIAEGPEEIIAITHEDDLQLFEGMETLTVNAVEKFLREKKMPLLIENGAAILRDPADDMPTVSDDKIATFYAAAKLNGESVPLDIHPALTKYLLKLDGLDTDHGYDLPNEEITSSAVYPHMQSLKIEYFKGYLQVFDVMASSNPRVGITVQDVLKNIHKHLGMPSRDSEIVWLSLEEQAEIKDAFKERCKTDEERRKVFPTPAPQSTMRQQRGHGRGTTAGGARAGWGRSGPVGGFSLIYNAGQRPQPDLSLVSPNAVIVRIRKLNSGPKRPARPGYGTGGRAVALRANFFALESMPDMIYEYIVQITPEPQSQKPRTKRRVIALFEHSTELRPYINDIAHDGAQRLVSSKHLPDITGSVLFYEEGDRRPPRDADKYDVAIIFFKELSTEPLKRFLKGDMANIGKVEDVDPVITALNLVMQRQAAQQGWRFGRNRYFFNDDNKARIGPRVWALMGFYSSVRPGNKLPFVNVNVCMSAFYEPGKLAEALRTFLMGSFNAIPREFMREVKVSTRYLGYKRVMTIQRVVSSSASRQTFNCQEFGGLISVKDYFLKKYNISLQHADDLPLIDAGAPGRSNYIPAELCDIEPGEPHLGKLGPKETSDMLKVASRRPAENTAIIMETGLPRLGYEPSTSVLQSFNIRIASQMAVIPGRELPPPSVTYGRGVPRVQNGSWNILDVKFHQGARMTNWKVLVVRDGVEVLSFSGPRDEKLINFIKAFANKCRNSGMDVGNEPPVILPTDQLLPIEADPGRRKALENISKTIERFGDARRISFILCLLQKRDDFIYPGIKRLCSVTHGIRTQCLLLEKALNTRKQDHYLSNVALKVNTKLGGINHRLGGDALGWLTKENTILVGIDVTHPGPSSVPGTPSIAGVVASVDKDFVQFPASLRLQKSKQEGIAELSDMITERLQAYRRRSPMFALPKRMIVFRDGVSETQYDMVIGKELPQIIAAFKRIDAKNPGYRPALSIVICGKRHGARFYPTDSEFADRNGNTRPGTVVDKGVTSMLDFDFYLQAHAGLQGTVKPTHYTVIYDESSLTADMIQQGVHKASYLYARATKAVSLVPPAYYADIVCEQARYWIHGFLNLGPGGDMASSTDRGGGGAPAASFATRKARETPEDRVFDTAQRLWGKGLHRNLQDCMFYI